MELTNIGPGSKSKLKPPEIIEERVPWMLDRAKSLLFGLEGGVQNGAPDQIQAEKSRHQEVLLLATLVLKELGGGGGGGGGASQVVDQAVSAAQLAGHVLLSHRKVGTFSAVLGCAPPEAASTLSLQSWSGMSAVAGGELERGRHLLGGVNTRTSSKDIPTLLMLAKACLSGAPPLTASAASEAAHHMQCALHTLQHHTQQHRGEGDDEAATAGGGGGGGMSYLAGRVHHLYGTALACGARHAPSSDGQAELQARALSHLQQAASLEPNDPAICYELALHLTHMGRRAEARCHLEGLLEGGRSVCSSSWRLAAELATDTPAGDAGRNWPAGLSVLKAGLAQIPKSCEQIPLHQTRAAIFRAAGNDQNAVTAMKESLSLLAAYKTDQGKLEVAKSEKIQNQLNALEVQVRGDLAEVYADLGMADDVEECCQRLKEILRHHSPELPYFLGRLAEVRGDTVKALDCYSAAVTLRPTNSVQAMLRSALVITSRVCGQPPPPLASLLQHHTHLDNNDNHHLANISSPPPPSPSPLSAPATTTGPPAAPAVISHSTQGGDASGGRLALGLLEDALRATPQQQLPQAWLCMATLLRHNGQVEEASQCMKAAVQLNLTVPVVPLDTFPRRLC